LQSPGQNFYNAPTLEPRRHKDGVCS
jgi:hypothetical protein